MSHADAATDVGRRQVAAARLLAREGFPAEAVILAYRAARHAAAAPGRVEGDVARLLRSLRDRAAYADHDLGEVPAAEADRAVADAATIVDAVAGSPAGA